MKHRDAHSLLTILLSAGFGVLAGMRSMAVPALLSRYLFPRAGETNRSVKAGKRGRLASTVLTGMAAGEMVTDKLPIAPNRTDLPSLAARTAIGAISAAVVARYRGDRLLPGMLVGAAAAFGATHTSFHLRRILREATPVPDPLLGVLEDLFVLRAGHLLTGMLDA